MQQFARKQLAIQEIATLMIAYTDYLERFRDTPFTQEIRDQLRIRAEKIRWLQQGLESGFYED